MPLRRRVAAAPPGARQSATGRRGCAVSGGICRRDPGVVSVLSADRAESIARHAAARASGRIGRTAAGRALDPDAIRLAVTASVRHVDTDYNMSLMSTVERETARHRVHQRVADVMNGWHDGGMATTRQARAVTASLPGPHSLPRCKAESG
nr:DUF2293 domain-containing protein [Mycobacterium persicum]